MVIIRGILKAGTMNVFAQEQGQRRIKSKLYFFYINFFLLKAEDAFFITKYMYDVTMTYFVTKNAS